MDWTGAAVMIDPPLPLEAGEVISVSVSAPYQLLTPFLGAFINSQTLTLTATSSAVIVRVQDCTNPAGCQ